MRGRDLEKPFPGARWRAGVEHDLLDRCRAYAARSTSDRFFCCLTAAQLLGMPVPWSRNEVLHVGVAAPFRAPRSRGVVGHSLGLTGADLIRVEGLWVTSHARTWRDLGSVLGVPDLVAAGDHLLAWSHVRIDDLRTALPGPRRRGSARLGAAFALLDPRAESPQESRLRAILVLGGLPAPVPNLTVTLAGSGVTYRIDLAYPMERVAVEYQGGYHHDPNQWRADVTRMSRLRAHGWEVIEVTKDDLRSPNELVARINLILARRRNDSRGP